MTNKSISKFVFRYRVFIITLIQAALVCFSLLTAWLLRFDFSVPYRSVLLATAPILIVVRLGAMAYYRLLKGWWQYAGVKEGWDILRAVTAGSAVFWVITRYLFHITAFPRSIYFLEPLLTIGLLVSVRLLSRAFAESVRENREVGMKVIVIGAGFAAQQILREISLAKSGYVAIGCLDDDRSKLGIRIHGIPVLGTVAQLPSIVSHQPADEVLIAVPSATGKQMERFIEICQEAGVKFKTVPALRDILNGHVSLSEFREVKLEDLLGRDPVQLDLQAVSRRIEGRTVLVTGAAGSIGSELCRQILEYAPSKLVCLDQSETGIFYLSKELLQRADEKLLVFCVADIGDQERMRICLGQHNIEVIFHAAAYKHVSVMEANVAEAVNNNVLALADLLDVAEEHGCLGFVLISSDKAVNPASIMGATKRVGELMLARRPQNGMRCVSVRFGNVLGSNGSVVPILQEQLRRNLPLTITHPDVQRFFMTTHEAVSLVLQAFAIGNHGDTLVLDMGPPVKILSLAHALIRLSGKSEQSVRLQFTGLGDGEKLIEELFYANEEVQPTACEKIKRTRSSCDGWSHLQEQLRQLRVTLTLDGASPIRAMIKEIVPEYLLPSAASQEMEKEHLASRSASS